MRISRLRFKYTLQICRQNEKAIRANAHAKALLEKDMLSFWKGVKKENNSRLPLSSKVNNCVGEENICKMWQTHYQTLLNSVKTTEHKERVLIETSETSNSSQITFTPIDISNAFKSLNIRKACGVDGCQQNISSMLMICYMYFYHCYLHLSLLMVIYHATL